MPKEGRFYVEYLGWKETRGLYGNDYLDPIMWKLLSRSETFRSLHRMTIKVNKDELQILQHVTAPNGKPQKIKYPAQQMCDVSYVAQSPAPHTDVVGCIFLGYNAKTRCAAHVHAYRFDSADTAAMFVKLVRSIIEQADLRERIIAMEQDLFRLGHIGVRTSLQEPDGMGSDGGSYGSHSSHSPNSSDSGAPRTYPRPEDAFKARKDIVIVKRTPSQKSAESSKLFNSMQDELSQKLEKDVPILLPPKDYDTIVRRYGHLSIRAKVKQRPVIGPDSVFRPPMEKSHSADGNNNPPQDRQVRIYFRLVFLFSNITIANYSLPQTLYDP